jgi:alkylation response protein AidB-like acyl-CoA dehydrogenase
MAKDIYDMVSNERDRKFMISAKTIGSLTSIAVSDMAARRSALHNLFDGSDADVRQVIASARPSGSLPNKLVDDLLAAGLVRLLLPAAFGGIEVDPGAVLVIIEELSRVSGSLGWTSMVACETPILLSLLPQRTFESLYASNPDILLASCSVVSGTAVRIPGGWSISGEWPFATGSSHCHFFLAYSRIPEGTVIGSLHPAQQLIRRNNWRSIGLKSTASNNVCLQDAFVPDNYTFPVNGSQSFSTNPIMLASPSEHFALHMAAVAMGILAHVLEIACENYRPQSARSPKRRFEEAGLIHAAGKATTVLRVARAATQSAIRDLLERAFHPAAQDSWEAAACLCVARYIVSECVETAQGIFAHSGSEVVFEINELQECLGDLLCLAQHANLSPGRFAQLGSLIVQYANRIAPTARSSVGPHPRDQTLADE